MMMWPVALLPAWLAIASLAPPPQAPSTAPPTSSKTWVGHYREVEEYLRTAECDGLEHVGPATSTLKRCVLRPGGPVARMSWRGVLPGIPPRGGFRESYKADIAAYELDKLLKMDMVPPVVERELQGQKGAATFWVEEVSPGMSGPPGAAERAHWDSQLAEMRLFDTLIGNIERNAANLLHDKAWNIVLLDHTRAFGTETDLVHDLSTVARDFWAKIERLTRKDLEAALGRWLEAGEIKAILDRREKMKVAINRRSGGGRFEP